MKIKRRRQEINYAYLDANVIPQINKYLMDSNLDMKLLRLSWDIINARVKIIFKSTFEVRRQIADKLRELDSDVPVVRKMKQDFYLNKERIRIEEKRYTAIEDKSISEEQTERINVGDTVKHFKGNKYLVLAIATHTETNKKLVIYQDLFDNKQIYARPYKMFMSKVDKHKYPDIEQEYRFEKYQDGLETIDSIEVIDEVEAQEVN